MSMSILIITDSNPAAWGPECDEATAQDAARILAKRLADYAQDQWPEAEVSTSTHRFTEGETTHLVRISDAPDEMTWAQIGTEIGLQAEAWWQEALAEAVGQ